MTWTSYSPMNQLISGDLFGSMLSVWTLSVGFIIFTIVWVVLVGLILYRTKSIVPAGLTGVALSVPMVAWPGSVQYLGPEGQLIALFLMIFSIASILVRIAIHIKG